MSEFSPVKLFQAYDRPQISSLIEDWMMQPVNGRLGGSSSLRHPSRSNGKFVLKSLVGAVLLVGCAYAAASNERPLRNPEFMNAATVGVAEIFNLDFDGASETFAELAIKYPQHPGPPLYQAATILIRYLEDTKQLDLDSFLHPRSSRRSAAARMEPRIRQQFASFLNTSRTLATHGLASDSADEDSRFYLGLVEGMDAAFGFIVDQSDFEGWRHGQQAYLIETQIVQQNRSFKDANLLPGMYGYISASLPWYLRWMTGADPKSAPALLNLCVDEAKYNSDEARLARMIVEAREGRFSESLADLTVLAGKYPRNYAFQLAKALLLERAGNVDDAAMEYRHILTMAEQRQPNYQRIDVVAFRWNFGNQLLARHPDAALDQYQKILSDPSASERWRVLAQMQAGCALDLLGRRDQAIDRYRIVLQLKEYDNSHAHASQYLQRPFAMNGNSISIPRLSPE